MGISAMLSLLGLPPGGSSREAGEGACVPKASVYTQRREMFFASRGLPHRLSAEPPPGGGLEWVSPLCYPSWGSLREGAPAKRVREPAYRKHQSILNAERYFSPRAVSPTAFRRSPLPEGALNGYRRYAISLNPGFSRPGSGGISGRRPQSSRPPGLRGSCG